MAKKQFKTESQKLLDMMIHSIYTHKEIFLRELISNASDALDKLYYRSLTDDKVEEKQGDLYIRITADKDARTLTVSDNGCGMTKEELENNLGTIAKSGSFDFKQDEKAKETVDVIGQFGVGFYSAFMVADCITVKSRAFGADESYVWQSSGVDGYTVEKGEKEGHGTEIVLHLLPDGEEEKYAEFLDEYKIKELVKRYSDYIRYPIRMQVKKQVPLPKEEGKENAPTQYETKWEDETLNSMTPLWKRPAADVKKEEYDRFYQDKYFDYEAPAKTIHTKTEGAVSFTSLLFVPSHAPFDYYTKNYEKGLQLYSSGVLIADKCADLLPDYFGFVRGLVDTSDLSLNISREMLQHDYQLKRIAAATEKKIRAELVKMMENDRETYEKVFDAFGLQLKYGAYADFGAHKDILADLLVFFSSFDKDKRVSLKEYVSRLKEGQNCIYYACGATKEAAALLPRAEAVVDRGYEVLYLCDDVDEFALRALNEYEGKSFKNVSEESLDIGSEEEKKALQEDNEQRKDLFAEMKEVLGGKVSGVRFSNTLKDHPVALSTEGDVSLEMEKVLNAMPNGEGQKVKAQTVLEINRSHPLADRLVTLFAEDKEKLASCTKILYQQARLIGGLDVENPTELSDLVCTLML